MSGFFTLNADRVTDGVRKVNANLNSFEERVIKEVTQATRDFTGLMMFEAQQRVPRRSDDLRDSVQIDEPRRDDEGVFTRGGFNKIYANIQDRGGTIRPVKADALAIPLRAIMGANGKPRFANPRQEPTLFVVRIRDVGYLAQRVGKTLELHWRFAQEVTLKGNRYLSGVLDERKKDMPAFVGGRVRNVVTRGRAG